ncbi:MAG: GDSL-type esterase/lipase family protein [Pseudomonadota bacterium]|nr:GDSL-type esterase/lipase family protein [Pseudomonadota bacterium]
MKRLMIVIALAAALLSGPARAIEPDVCEVPGYLLFGESELKHVAKAVKERKHLEIAVIGTGSSILPGSGVTAYPARLEAALRARLPGVTVNVTSLAKPRQTAAEMVQNIKKLLSDLKPDLVIWQSGTVDAMRGIELDKFGAAIDQGIERIQAAGTDVILMNMQYSPRTESMIAVDLYIDSMRASAREHEVPMFDRFAIMRNWSDSGAFDLYTATTNPAMAEKVHDCIGHALASVVIDAARLSALETKAAR